MKPLRHRRLLITLFVILAVVFLGVVWIVSPDKPKDLTLHLKFVKSEVVKGETKLLFTVQGAEGYAITITALSYVHGKDQSASFTNTIPFFSLIRREYYVDPPQYSPLNVEGLKMQANVSVLGSAHNLSALHNVIKYTWEVHKHSGRPVFAVAKTIWNYPTRSISDQTITSDVITNVPIVTELPSSIQWLPIKR